MGPLRRPHATRNRRVHHPRPPATGSAPHRRSAARAAPPSLRQRAQRPLQVPPPQRTGPPQRRLLVPPPQRTGRLNRRRHRPAAPLPAQMDPKSAEWSDQRPRPWLPPTLRMAHRLAVGSRRWNRPRVLHGGWRGSRDSMSTVQGVRMSRRVAPDGRPRMPGGWTPRWTPPSTGRPARRRSGPGRWARRHPGRVSGPPPTRAVASSPRPPTRRPRDPADAPRGPQVLSRNAATSTRPPSRRRRDLARGRCHRRGGVRWNVRRSSRRPGRPGGRGRVGAGPSQPPTGPWSRPPTRRPFPARVGGGLG
jgi:hypothetical protein